MVAVLVWLVTVMAAAVVGGEKELSVFGLHVVGNQIKNEHGKVIRLLGATRSGPEYACVHGWGVYDGPTDDESIDAMKEWHLNAVRIPLNEDCWLGINGVNPRYSGLNYQEDIISFVDRINAHNMAVILDLHWSAPGASVPFGLQPMPNADHSIAFWESVAKAFSSYSAVLFDVFNEPYPDNNRDTPAAWGCWTKGGVCSGLWYSAASMQSLVDAIRRANATNIILVGGVRYSNALSQWLTNMPTDPLRSIGASWHSYSFNKCNTQSCWESEVRPVALKVPVVVTEFGENDCDTVYVNPLMDWMDSLGLSYLGWTWNTWDCSVGPSLISDYTGTPTHYGRGLRDHLRSLFGPSVIARNASSALLRPPS